jgi:hypothetical protein
MSRVATVVAKNAIDQRAVYGMIPGCRCLLVSLFVLLRFGAVRDFVMGDMFVVVVFSGDSSCYVVSYNILCK